MRAVTDGKLSDFSLPSVEWIPPQNEKSTSYNNVRDTINESTFEEKYVKVISRDYIRPGEGMAGLRLLDHIPRRSTSMANQTVERPSIL